MNNLFEWLFLVVLSLTLLGICLVQSFPNGIDHYSFWLQGTLTPVGLFFAAYSLKEAQRNRTEQANAQAKIAEITERATILERLQVFYGHFDYVATCAIQSRRLSRPQVDALPAMKRGFSRLYSVLTAMKNPNPDEDIVSDYGRLIKSPFLDEFLDDLKLLEMIGQTSRVGFLIDRRLQELPSLIADARKANG